MNRLRHKTEKELYKLFYTYFYGKKASRVNKKNDDIIIDDIIIKCTDFHNKFNLITDEVVTFSYKIHLYIYHKFYTYEGWCYEDDIYNVAFGVFCHWLVNNNKIYDGESTAWYNMYVGRGNIVSKDEE